MDGKKRFARASEQNDSAIVRKAFNLNQPEPDAFESPFSELLATQSHREAQIRENLMRMGGYQEVTNTGRHTTQRAGPLPGSAMSANGRGLQCDLIRPRWATTVLRRG
jgi:hypothetical protein